MTTPNCPSPTPTRSRYVPRPIACLLVAATGVVVYAQSANTQKFEVSSVRANKSNAPMQALPTLQPSGRVFAINLPLRELIQAAYGLRDNQLIISSPIAEARFDIEARAGANVTREAPWGFRPRLPGVPPSTDRRRHDHS